MSQLSDNVENAVLNVIFRAVPYPYGGGTFLSLHTANPGGTGLFEIVGAGYARKSGAWNTPAGGVVALATDLDFDNMPAGPVNYFGIWTPANVFVGFGEAPNAVLNLGDSYRLFAGTTYTVAGGP